MPKELVTLRDLLRYAVSRFNEAGLFFGHGTDNAWDEAVYLLLHTLHLPLDRLEPFLDARLTASEQAQREASGKLSEELLETLTKSYVRLGLTDNQEQFLTDLVQGHIADMMAVADQGVRTQQLLADLMRDLEAAG